MNAPLKKESRRILSLWFPHLSTERLMRQRLGRSWRSRPRQGQPPLVISQKENNTQRIAALDEAAAQLRLRPGMGIADARAMYPSIEIVAADPDADRKLLEALADWCDRYTPLVAIDGTDGLFLDITGCAHLFGGEEAMLNGILSRFLEQGFVTRAGLAATPGAAWAAARFSEDRIVIHDGEEKALLQDLPLAALRLETSTVARLESVGLRTVGMITNAPRAPLARRFGAMLLARLDQALGEMEEALSPRLPVPAFSIERHLAEPIDQIEEIERLAHLLTGSLKRELERHGKGARRFDLLLFRVDGAVTRVSTQSSLPLRDPIRICGLFHERFAALGSVLEPGYGFDLIRLAAFDTGQVDAVQTNLDGETKAGNESAGHFADRVRARLGRQAILSPLLIESHLPERAALLVSDSPPEGPVPRQRTAGLATSRPSSQRPLRLFARSEPIDVPMTELPEGPPLSFRWRGSLHYVSRAEGPERIGHEWWLRGAPNVEDIKPQDSPRKKRQKIAQAVASETAQLTRDYFRVEDIKGRRFWLYREGLYGFEIPPRWFMQGWFA